MSKKQLLFGALLIALLVVTAAMRIGLRLVVVEPQPAAAITVADATPAVPLGQPATLLYEGYNGPLSILNQSMAQTALCDGTQVPLLSIFRRVDGWNPVRLVGYFGDKKLVAIETIFLLTPADRRLPGQGHTCFLWVQASYVPQQGGDPYPCDEQCASVRSVPGG